MIEQFLQTALEFLKEIWFQLDSRFDLENTEAFKFLNPYLLQLQDNPLYMGISIAALFLVPYTLYKVRSVSKEREQKLDELMEEMEDEEEEYDEDDPRRLRRSEPELNNESDELEKPLFGSDEDTSHSDDEDDDLVKPLFADDEDTTLSDEEDLLDEESVISEEDLEAELDDFELETAETTSDNEESSDIETTVEPVSSLLTESEFDKELNEFMADELDWNKDEQSADNDLEADLSLEDNSSHDQAIKELQEEGKLMELDTNLPSDDPFANYSELNEDEQDKAIKDLQDEMERTINQLTQQIDEPSEIPSAIKDLSQIHIGGDTTIDEGYSPEEKEEEYFLEDSPEKRSASKAPEIQSEDPSPAEISPSISELSDAEILASLETELDTTGSDTTSKEIPDTHDYVPDIPSFTFKPEADIVQNELDIESEITSKSSYEPEPTEDAQELKSKPSSFSHEGNSSSPEKTDSLIDRLKFLQERFENRNHPLEPMRPPVPVEKKTSNYEAGNLAEPRRYTRESASVPPDSKKYMDLLESFIFMKDQNKHK